MREKAYEDFYSKNAGILPGLFPPDEYKENLPIEGDIDTSPTLKEMSKNFTKSMINFAKMGFKVSKKKEFSHRLSICKKCPKWSPNERLGLGKCLAKGCGCTFLKLWIKHESCPLDKW